MMSDKWWVASVPPPQEKGDDLRIYKGWQPCIDWCVDEFGLSLQWRFQGEGVFEFKNQQDCVWFLLKWQ